MRIIRASLFGLLLLTVCAAPRSARAADAPVAVLGMEASEGAPDTVAAAITDALRQKVASTKGFRLVPGRDLVEVKLVFSCPDEAPSCMAQAGKSLGAAKLIFGSVKKGPADNYLVTLKLLDANRGAVEAWTAEPISKAQGTPAAIRGPVQKWFASLTGQGALGIVRVRGDVIGASVALDGTPVGTVGTDDLVLPGIAAGKHEVVVTKPGYEPVRREVTVGAGETAEVEIKMAKSAAAVDAPAAADEPRAATLVPPRRDGPGGLDDGDGRGTLRVATWGVLGAGLVGVALAVKFGLDVKEINADLDPYRRFPCSASRYGCDPSGKPATRALRQDEIDYVNAKKEDGRRLETFQYISAGVGAALIVTSGYLFYRAYLQEGAETAQAPGRRVVLAPVVGPGMTGLAGALRF